MFLALIRGFADGVLRKLKFYLLACLVVYRGDATA